MEKDKHKICVFLVVVNHKGFCVKMAFLENMQTPFVVGR